MAQPGPPTDEPRSHETRPHEPLVSGVRDGVEHGYRAIETVLEGIRGSVEQVASRAGGSRQMSRAAAAQPNATDGSSRRTTSSAGAGGAHTRPLGELLEVMTDLLAYAGEVAVDLADGLTHGIGGVGGREHHGSDGPAILRSGPVAPGHEVDVVFHLHNRAAHVSGRVDFTATDLAGASTPIPSEAVRFDPEVIDRIGPGGTAEVVVTVAVPDDTKAGRFRGTIHATVGDAWAVVEVEVVDAR